MREFALSLVACVGALTFAVSAVAGPRDDVLTAVASWSRAVVANDPRAVGEFVADDWTLIAADGAVLTKASFLGVMASGELVHDVMTLDSPVVRLYDDVAVVSGVATSTGTYRGQRFATHERSTDVFIWRNGRWRCVLTQLTAVSR
jgi:ketosteroid isomerase-like protein